MISSENDGAIIVGGEKYVIPSVSVHTWHDTGMKHEPPNIEKRKEPARIGVVHWTASSRTGEEGARKMYEHHKQNGLSVEWMITNEGTLWQFFDPFEFRGRHCSRVNPYAVGVEVSGYGWAGKRGRKNVDCRDVYEARIHGWRTTWFDFLPAQYPALFGLANAVCEAIPTIERNVMTYPWAQVNDLTLARFSGWAGHLHFALGEHPKCDPGRRPLEKLAYFFGFNAR